MYGTIYNRLLCEINGRYINMFKNIVVRALVHNTKINRSNCQTTESDKNNN